MSYGSTPGPGSPRLRTGVTVAGRDEGALRGSLKGASLGALLGGFVYAVDQGSKRPDGLCGDLSSGIARCTTGNDVFSMTAGTALLGAALGALHPGERWLPVKPEPDRTIHEEGRSDLMNSPG